MKKILYICVLVLVLVCASAFLPSEEELSVYDGVIRLHILANSDSEADQALKLHVRDRILSEVGGIVEGAETKEEAEAAISSSLDVICTAASSAVREYGADASVSVTLSEEKYPRKSYGTVILPSGTYTSLRVMLGEAEGANWWCVLFPDICTSPAIKTEKETADEFIEAGFTPSQYRLISGEDEPKYVIKFRIVEIFESLFGG